MKIDLIQPRHIYASDDGVGQVYLPTSLMTVAARLLQAGIEVEFFDENLKSYDGDSSIIGFSLLGAPYVYSVIQRISQIQSKSSQKLTFLLGGQVINGFTTNQFKSLFGSNHVLNGNLDNNLVNVLNINIKSLPKPEQTSLIPIYEKINDSDMRLYLENEFSFYLSQGCKYTCEFCAAVRSRKDRTSGKTIIAKEIYRDFDVIEQDLVYLINRAIKLELDELKIYLSNLDLFQTPDCLKQFTSICKRLKSKYPEFRLHLRGLASVTSFVNMSENYAECLFELNEVGLTIIGFGIDGMTPEVWKSIKKGHNSEDKCLQAISLARNVYNITPELLMTFGHNDADTEDSLSQAYKFVENMIREYQAVPRPHIAKSFIPGNDGWYSANYKKQVELLIKKPILFQCLDFTALPTRFTHSNDIVRELAKNYFLKMCNLKENTTKYVKSITPGMSKRQVERINEFNLNRYDR